MNKLRILAVTAAAVALTSTFTAVGANAAPTVHRAVTLGPSSVGWHGCNAASGLQGVPGAQCAFVPVPLDYANPSGPKIKLAISRIQHTVPIRSSRASCWSTRAVPAARD